MKSQDMRKAIEAWCDMIVEDLRKAVEEADIAAHPQAKSPGPRGFQPPKQPGTAKTDTSEHAAALSRYQDALKNYRKAEAEHATAYKHYFKSPRICANDYSRALAKLDSAHYALRTARSRLPQHLREPLPNMPYNVEMPEDVGRFRAARAETRNELKRHLGVLLRRSTGEVTPEQVAEAKRGAEAALGKEFSNRTKLNSALVRHRAMALDPTQRMRILARRMAHGV
jgi:hypothetical protein